MIEALIAAALAGAVTTLVRARRRNKDIDGKDEVYDGSTPSIDVGAANSIMQGYVEDGKKSRMMVHKGIEHRIRSMADIRLKKYLNDGRISEDEYRELTSYGYASSNSSNADVNGGDAYVHTGYGIDHMHDESSSRSSKSRKKIESDSMMMQEILLRLDRLNSRLDSLEGKIDANKIGSQYITSPSTLPTTTTMMLAQVQDQVHAYNHDSRKRSSRVQRRGRASRKRMANDGGSVRMVKSIEKGDEGREDKKDADDEGLEVMAIDANSNPDSITKTSMMEKKEEMGSISYEQWHKMGYDDSRRYDNNTTNTNNNNSIDNTIIAGSSNYDSSNNDELESIKKQIMDALERLEKDA